MKNNIIESVVISDLTDNDLYDDVFVEVEESEFDGDIVDVVLDDVTEEEYEVEVEELATEFDVDVEDTSVTQKHTGTTDQLLSDKSVYLFKPKSTSSNIVVDDSSEDESFYEEEETVFDDTDELRSSTVLFGKDSKYLSNSDSKVNKQLLKKQPLSIDKLMNKILLVIFASFGLLFIVYVIRVLS